MYRQRRRLSAIHHRARVLDSDDPGAAPDPVSARTWRLFTIRGLAHALGVITWFFAMTRIPIAEVTAMNYMVPVYVTGSGSARPG